MKRKFVETEIFQEDLKSYKINERSLEKLQLELLENPKKGDLIKGSGGTRKVRIPRAGKGKSGGYRVLYTDFMQAEVIYLWLILDKTEQSNLSADQKSILREFNNQISKELTGRA